jgi:16S rRNA (uracil1498-N3)-methyltransferase
MIRNGRRSRWLEVEPVRIFVKPLTLGHVTVHGDEHHYLSRVRRSRAGDQVELVDGSGKRAHAQIVRITETMTILHVATVETATDLPPRVRVLIPLIKGDRMDTCLEKLVEVGADEIVVWPATRAVVRLDPDRLDGRIAKFQAAVVAAARQSGRATIPTVSASDSLAAAIAALPEGARVVLDPSADRAPFPLATDLSILSGPEGGFAPEELDAVTIAGFLSIGLGPRTLRAETAPVIAVALVRAATIS